MFAILDTLGLWAFMSTFQTKYSPFDALMLVKLKFPPMTAKMSCEISAMPTRELDFGELVNYFGSFGLRSIWCRRG